MKISLANWEKVEWAQRLFSLLDGLINARLRSTGGMTTAL